MARQKKSPVVEQVLQTEIEAVPERLNVEDVLMSFLDTTPDAVVLLDASGNIVRANVSSTRLFEVEDRSKLLRKPLAFFLDPSFRAGFNDYVAAAQNHETFENVTLDARIRGARGHVSMVEISVGSTPLPDVVSIFIRDVTRRKNLETELLKVAGEERRRLAADLHDSLCQEMSAVHFGISNIGRQLPKGSPAKLRALAATVTSLAEATVNHARTIAHGLSPMLKGDGALGYALQSLAKTVCDIHQVDCVFTGEHSDLPLDEDIATQFYHIAQEATNNALHHGRATVIRISMRRRPNELVMTVRDNGCGFVQTTSSTGRGIHFMRYRASLINASLKLVSKPGAGTEVTCRTTRMALASE